MGAEELAPYVYLPVPTLKDLPNPSASRDEKLRTIIANLDKQHQTVRSNIISAAKCRLEEQKEQQKLATKPFTTASPDADPNSMDIDTPSPGEILPEDPAIAHAESVATSQATALLIHNLNAPWDYSSGDPCVSADGTLPASPREIRQSIPPLEIHAAKEAMRLVGMYDAQAGEAREYYVKALRRRSSSSGAAATVRGAGMGTGTGSGVWSGYGSAVGAGGYGRANASPANWSSAPSPANHQVNASPIDTSRDPRRRGR